VATVPGGREGRRGAWTARIIVGWFLFSGIGLAGPITFTFEGTGSGSGTTSPASFFNAPFTFSLTTDTTLISSTPTGFVTPLVAPGSVSLDGTTGTFLFGSGPGNGVGVEVDGSSISLLLEENYWEGAGVSGDSSSLAGYDLESALGPLILDSPGGGMTIPTSFGTFSFWSVSNATFTATTGSAVPEPATAGLAGGILLLGGFAALARTARRPTASSRSSAGQRSDRQRSL
jgi:hypothetical protein